MLSQLATELCHNVHIESELASVEKTSLVVYDESEGQSVRVPVDLAQFTQQLQQHARTLERINYENQDR